MAPFFGPPCIFTVYCTQWLNYLARGGGSLQARGLEGRSSSPKGREQRWGSRPPTRGFRAFKALWLAFIAFKVFYTCNIYLYQAWTSANDKMTVKGDFFHKTSRIQKYSNINCAEWWISAKRCRISIVRYRICY